MNFLLFFMFLLFFKVHWQDSEEVSQCSEEACCPEVVWILGESKSQIGCQSKITLLPALPSSFISSTPSLSLPSFSAPVKLRRKTASPSSLDPFALLKHEDAFFYELKLYFRKRSSSHLLPLVVPCKAPSDSPWPLFQSLSCGQSGQLMGDYLLDCEVTCLCR